LFFNEQDAFSFKLISWLLIIRSSNSYFIAEKLCSSHSQYIFRCKISWDDVWSLVQYSYIVHQSSVIHMQITDVVFFSWVIKTDYIVSARASVLACDNSNLHPSWDPEFDPRHWQWRSIFSDWVIMSAGHGCWSWVLAAGGAAGIMTRDWAEGYPVAMSDSLRVSLFSYDS
jgi:hypothetical protein